VYARKSAVKTVHASENGARGYKSRRERFRDSNLGFPRALKPQRFQAETLVNNKPTFESGSAGNRDPKESG